MSETVQHGKVVGFHYKLTLDSGEVVDESGNHPLPYLHGYGNIVPGLEKEMTGKSVGDAFTVQVPAAEGYGERLDVDPQKVSASIFPPDFPVEKGSMVPVETDDGQQLVLFISEIKGDEIFLDPNHPLAGEQLHFDIEITLIRDANEDELAHNHPHGLDGTSGHHH